MIEGLELTHPKFLEKLESLGRFARKAFSGELGVDRSGFGKRGAGTLFQEHRRYAYGDDTRHIDWNVYGRLNELFVKVFEPEERASLSIFLDASPSMGTGAKARLAYELAAAFGYIALSCLDGVQLSVFPGAKAQSFHGESEIRHFLEYLQSLKIDGQEKLSQSIEKTLAGTRSKSWTWIFSDFYPPEEMDRSLARLTGRRLCCVHLLDPLELDPNDRGAVQFQDLESGRRRWLGVSQRLRSRYQQLMEVYLREVASIAAQRNSAYFRVFSQESFDAACLRILTGAKSA